MNLGEKIRQARLEAGLSQRQLCAGEITRNMLSRIENGSANPSMATLRFLADRLNRPVSFFLEEQAVTSSNESLMTRLRKKFEEKDWNGAISLLDAYHAPDPVFDWERALLESRILMELAAQALAEQRLPYAVQLLERAGRAGGQTPYYGPAQERDRLLLLYRALPGKATMLEPFLPDGDSELLLRAEAALDRGDPELCAHLLDSARDRESPQWNYLRGQIWQLSQQPEKALNCYRKAESRMSREVLPRMEQCFLDLGDYKMAYEYARRQR